MSTDASKSPHAGPKSHRMPFWTKALVALSILVMAAGLVLPLIFRDAPASASGGSLPAGVAGLSDGGTRSATDSAPSAGSSIAAHAPAIFRVGFSFFAAFAIGYALRTFFGFAIAAVGFFFLVLFGLQYAGLIEVKWGLIEQRYDTISQAAQSEAKSLWTTISGYLPSGAAASGGLFAGWRRKVV